MASRSSLKQHDRCAEEFLTWLFITGFLISALLDILLPDCPATDIGVLTTIKQCIRCGDRGDFAEDKLGTLTLISRRSPSQ